MSRRSGFSLLELLIAMAVIAVVVGAAMPAFEGGVQETRRAKAKLDIEKIVDAIQRFQRNRGHFLTGDDLTPLVGATLQELPLDPWGNEYFFDGDLGLVGSTAGRELGIEDRAVVTQYTTYLAPVKARFLGGGFGRTSWDQRLEIRFNKPFEVPAGLEALVAQDVFLLLSGELPIPVPAAALGYAYLPGESKPAEGILLLKAATPPPGAPFVPGRSRVALSSWTAALTDVLSPTAGTHLIDTTPYIWGPEPLSGEGGWAGVEIGK